MEAEQSNFKGKEICFNPTCQASRLIFITQNKESVLNEHLNCQGWIHGLSSLKQLFNSSNQNVLNKIHHIDFLKNPIQSIFIVEAFSSIKWEDFLFKFLQEIKKEIEEELTQIYLRSQSEIKNYLNKNRQISARIQSFCEFVNQQKVTPQNEIYISYLQPFLSNIQKQGKIQILSPDLLQKNKKDIFKQLKLIEQCIWSKQLPFNVEQRMKIRKQREEIISYDKLSVIDISTKIQDLERIFKQKIQFIEEKDEIHAQCFICKTILNANTSPTIKLRRQQSRKLMLNHLCTIHTNELLQKMPKDIPVKLTLEDLKKDIVQKNIQKIIIIDKENMTINKNTIQSYSNLYCIEVLSKNSEHLAKIRHLVAESKGKDAADILIIIVLYQLSKLKLEQITLLTNDHYGQTLQPIFAHIGVSIKIINKLDQSRALNSSNSIILEQ